MNQKNLSHFFKIAVIFLGIVCFAFTSLNIKADVFSLSFILLLVFAVIVVPRLSLKLPRYDFWASFSEPIVFITFFLYSGEAAIILVTLEMAANCYYLKSTGVSFRALAVPFNIFSMTLSTTFAYIAWLFIAQPISISQQTINTHDLIINLGVLALAQFLATSILAAILFSLTHHVSIWQTWKKECFSS